jgi:flagellin
MAQINTNLNALSAQRFNARSSLELGTSLQRLSSGLRINSARDDAAGLAISERLTSAVTGLSRAGKNTNDAISLLQVAESTVTNIIDNFQRIRELAVQSLNGSNSVSDRQDLQAEANTLVIANYQFASQAEFNHQKLLDGSFSSQFQIGANQADTLGVSIAAVFLQPSIVQHLADVPLRQVNLTGQVSAALGVGELTINGTAVGASVAGAGAGQGQRQCLCHCRRD